jgi:hypothetical protein
MKKFVLGFILIAIVSFNLTVFAAEFNPLDYKDNYQAEISRLKSLTLTEDIQDKINLLVYYRIRKIATDFDIYEKYLTSDDIAYMDGVDLACFSDKPALSNLKEQLVEWNKTGWQYDEKTLIWTKQ